MSTLTHAQLWKAIDAFAARHGMSPSGLAKAAGLDPTTFNKSKRVSPDGRERWPNTESLSKVLDATGSSLEEFMENLLSGPARQRILRPIPVIGFAQAGGGGYFDDGGFPVGGGWETVTVPQVDDEQAYALEVTGDSMEPVYRNGDTIVVSPNAGVRRGDRVVVKTMAGEVMAKVLARRTDTRIELQSLNPAYETRVLSPDDILWMARIVWASQ